MTNYPYSAYGPNPWAGRNVNADNGWGPWKWPGGVPSTMLSSFSVPAGGGVSHLTFRSELETLVRLSFQIAEKHGYTIWAVKNGVIYGPWSYENRAISGTSSASNHSRGRAWDVNAPENPYTSPLVCDMPPAMVNDFEAVGWAWGGRYSGRKDAMHYEAVITPSEVPLYVAKARAILGGSTVTAPAAPAKPAVPVLTAAQLEEKELMAAKDDIIKELRPLGLVRASTSGAVWAFGPGTFTHISPSQLAAGVKTGLYQPDVTIVTAAELDALQTACLAESPPGKPSSVAPIAAAKPSVYTVVSGDSFNAVAAKLKTTPAALKAANPAVKDVNALEIGQKLNVPK